MNINLKTKFNIGDQVIYNNKKYIIQSITISIYVGDDINIFYCLKGKHGSVSEDSLIHFKE